MKLTQKHFEIFKNEMNYWADEFSLRSWSIRFFFKKSEKTFLAKTDVFHTARLAIIVLNNEWPSDDPTDLALCEVAFHEACEILLLPMCRFNHKSVDDRVTERRHAIIHRLENTVFYPNYMERRQT